MPTHVYANCNEIASKAADGKSLAAFPDVCFSPPSPPVGPLPLPYPNTGMVKDTDKGTAKVFVKDKMSGMEGDSYISKSTGDEPATPSQGKGLITGTLQGKCYFKSWSMDVKMEGKGVPRHMDMVSHNHGSDPGNGAFGVDLDMATMPETTPAAPEEEKHEEKPKDSIHVPIVFLPGFMGSVLKKKGTDKIIWSINNLGAIFGILGFTFSINNKNRLNKILDNFSDGTVEAYHEKESDSKLKKHIFNWKSTLFLLYRGPLQNMEKTLNALTTEDDGERTERIEKLTGNLKRFYTLSDGSIFDATALAGKESKLKEYTFDIWGCGYNWLQSNEKSAEDVGAFITTQIAAYYDKKGDQYLGGSGNIQAFVVTHSMGGLVGRALEKSAYKKNIKGIIYGGLPLAGAAAFYYAAQVGLKYMMEFAPAGIMKKMISTIVSNSQGCLELLPFGGKYNSVSDDTNTNSFPESVRKELKRKSKKDKTIPEYYCVDTWMHLDVSRENHKEYASIYDFYKDKGALGVYPESINKKSPFGVDSQNNFSQSIEKIKDFHKKICKVPFSDNGYYLWGDLQDEEFWAIGEISFIRQKNSKKLKLEKTMHAGDGTVPKSSWEWAVKDGTIKADNALGYKYQKDIGDPLYPPCMVDATFGHMAMFSNTDVINCTCYLILKMLLK